MTFDGKTGEFKIVGKDPNAMLEILNALKKTGSVEKEEPEFSETVVYKGKEDKRIKRLNKASHLTKWLPEELRAIADNTDLSYPSFKRQFGQQHPESSFGLERSKIRAVLKKGDYNTGYYYSRKERTVLDPYITRRVGNSVYRPFATVASPELA